MSEFTQNTSHYCVVNLWNLLKKSESIRKNNNRKLYTHTNVFVFSFTKGTRTFQNWDELAVADPRARRVRIHTHFDRQNFFRSYVCHCIIWIFSIISFKNCLRRSAWQYTLIFGKTSIFLKRIDPPLTEVLRPSQHFSVFQTSRISLNYLCWVAMQLYDIVGKAGSCGLSKGHISVSNQYIIFLACHINFVGYFLSFMFTYVLWQYSFFFFFLYWHYFFKNIFTYFFFTFSIFFCFCQYHGVLSDFCTGDRLCY